MLETLEDRQLLSVNAPFDLAQDSDDPWRPAGIAAPAGSPGDPLPPAPRPIRWVSQGPGPTLDGQVEGMEDQGNPVVGALHTVVAHPTNADILYVGSVNGGIWKTTNATDANSIWIPQTDTAPSLSIGAMEMDPTDATNNTLLAGIGRYSSLRLDGGDLTGLLYTTNGGVTWTPLAMQSQATGGLANANISGVAPRGSTMVVSANSQPNLPGSGGGVYRSINGGLSFHRVSGSTGVGDGVDNDGDGATDEAGELNFPAGNVSDLVGDRLNNNRLYAAVMDGASPGIYRSDDAGLIWRNVTTPAVAAVLNANTNNIEMAVHSSAANAVYAAIMNTGQLAGIFRSANLGGAWTAMNVPRTNEGVSGIGLQPRAQPGGQGAIHFSIAADPNNANIVYVGGDRQPGNQGTPPLDFFSTGGSNSLGAMTHSGRLFRGDASITPTGGVPSPQWTSLTHSGTSGNSAPHADSREMVFDADGTLIEVDDGGIYRRTSPGDSSGDWFGLMGDLRVAELHSAVWDANRNTVLAGAQDTGTPEQVSAGNTTWRSVDVADGNVVVVDDSGSSDSIHYSSRQRLGGFRRRTIDPNNNVSNDTPIALIVSGTGGKTLHAFDGTVNARLRLPYALNAVDPARMVIGTSVLYESTDRGDNLTALGGVQVANADAIDNDGDGIIDEVDELGAVSPVGTVAEIIYGGFNGAVGNAAVLYVGLAGSGLPGGSVLVRTAGNGLPTPTPVAFPGTGVVDIAIDSADWRTLYVLDSTNHVWRTPDVGATWTEITGNLGLLSTKLQTIAVVPGQAGAFDAIFVGGRSGVFATTTLAGGMGQWIDVGAALPNAYVYDLNHNRKDDVLVAGTMGRGAWTLGRARAAMLGDISGVVWADADGDGIHDPEEFGRSGVTVEAWNSVDGTIGNGDDVSVGTLLIDDGEYTFSDLVPGQYYLKLNLPTEAAFSPRDQGDDDSLDSDADRLTGRTGLIGVVSAGISDGNDAGLILADRFEQNDSITAAAPLGAVVDVHFDNLSISAPGDRDYYKLQLLHAGDVEVQIAFEHDFGNLALEVIGPNQATVLGSSNTATDRESVRLTGLAAGVYYIHVFGVGSAVNAFNLDALTYRVHVGDVLPLNLDRLVRGTEYRLQDATWINHDPAGNGQGATIDLDFEPEPGHPAYRIRGNGGLGAITMLTAIPSQTAEPPLDPETPGGQGGEFFSTGRVYISPNHVDDGWGFLDADPSSPGFQGSVELKFSYRDASSGETRELRVRLDVLPCEDVLRDMLNGTEEDIARRIALAGTVTSSRGRPLSDGERQVDLIIQSLNETAAAIQSVARDALEAFAGVGLPISSDTIGDLIGFDVAALTRTLYDPLVLRAARTPSGGTLSEAVHLLIQFDERPPISIAIPDTTLATPADLAAAIQVALENLPIDDPEYFQLDTEADPRPEYHYDDVLEAFSDVPLTGGPGVGIRTRAGGLARTLTLTTLRIAAITAATLPLPPSEGIAFDVTLTLDSTQPGEESPDPVTARVTLPGGATGFDSTPENLARVMNSAFAATRIGDDDSRRLGGELYVFVEDGKLVIASVDPLLKSILLEDAGSGGLELLGLVAGLYEEVPAFEAGRITTGFHGTQSIARPAFANIPELMEHLAPYLGVPQQFNEEAIPIAGAGFEWDYDNERKLLTFNFVIDPAAHVPSTDPDAAPLVNTSHTATINWPVSLGDGALFHVEGAIAGSAKVQLALNVGVGIYLGPSPDQLVIHEETLLAEFNRGEGVEIVAAVTGAEPAGWNVGGRQTGRLSDDNQLQLILNRGLSDARTINLVIHEFDERFADNLTVLELVDDVNDVLDDYGIGDLVEAQLGTATDDPDPWTPVQIAYLTFRADDPSIRTLEVENLQAFNLGFVEDADGAAGYVNHHELEVVVNEHRVLIDLDGVTRVDELIARFNQQAVKEVPLPLPGGGNGLRWIAELARADDGFGLVVRSPPKVDADTPAELPPPLENPPEGITLHIPGSFVNYGASMHAGTQLGLAGTVVADCGGQDCAELRGGVLDSFGELSERIYFDEPAADEPPTVKLLAEAVFADVHFTGALGSVQFDLDNLDTDDEDATADPIIFRAALPIRLTDPGAGRRYDGKVTLDEIFSNSPLDVFVVDPDIEKSLTLGLTASLFGEAPERIAVWQSGPELLSLGSFADDPAATPPEIDLDPPAPPPAGAPAAAAAPGTSFVERLGAMTPALIVGAFTGAVSALRDSDVLDQKIPVIGKSINELTDVADAVLAAVEGVLAGVDAVDLQEARDAVASAIVNLDVAATGMSDLDKLAAAKETARAALTPINAYLAASEGSHDLARLVAGAGQLRKVVARELGGTLGSTSQLADDLRRALDNLDLVVPALNRLPQRLSHVINELLPTGVTVNVGLVKYDASTTALVLSLNLDIARLLDEPLIIEPTLPASVTLGPIQIIHDYELHASADVNLAFGFRLDDPGEPFLVVGKPDPNMPSMPPWLRPSSIEFTAGFGGEVRAQLQLGGLASDLIGGGGEIGLLAAEVFTCAAPACGVSNSTPTITLPEGPAYDPRFMIVVFGEGSGARVLTQDQFTLDGNELTVSDGDLLSAALASISVRHLPDGSPFPGNIAAYAPSDEADRASLSVYFEPTVTPANLLGAMPIDQLGVASAGKLRFDAEGLLVAALDVTVLGRTAEDAVTLAIGLDHPLDPQFVVDEAALAGMFATIDFDLLTIVDGISAFLGLLEEGLTSEVVAKLPVVGEGFDTAGTFIGKLRENLVVPFRDFLDSLSGNAEEAEDDIRQHLYGIFGPDGLGVVETAADPADVIHVDIESDFFEIRFKIEGEDRVRVASFDTGLAGLPLSGTGGVDFGWRYMVDVGLGVDRLKGFYLLTNVPEDGENHSLPEITLEIDAGLAVEPSGGATSLSLELFGLRATATDAPDRGANGPVCPAVPSGTAVCGAIDLTLSDALAGSRGEILWSEIADAGIDDLVDFDGGVEARLNLDLDLGAGADLPSITAELSAGWALDLATGEVTGSALELGNIGINAGEFLSKYLKPVIEKVNEILVPIRPVLDLLTEPIPVLAQLYKIAEGRNVSILDLVAEYAPAQYEGVAKFVSVIAQIAPVVSMIESAVEADESGVEGDEVIIRFGDLTFTDMPGDPIDLSEPNWRNVENLDDHLEDLAALADPVLRQIGVSSNVALGQALAMISGEPKSRGPSGLGIKLGILDAENIFRFLLGQSEDLGLVEWPIPAFHYEIGAEMRFPVLPVPPVSLTVAAGFESSLQFSIGLDTRGFRTGNFLDGFYFGDRADVSTGEDIDEFRFELLAALGAALGVPGLSVGVRGELQADVAANWRDDDDNGKIYLDEIADTIDNGGTHCLFDLSGAMRAQLAVTWEVLFFSGRIPITDPIEIFTIDNFDACPVIRPAHVSEGGEALPDGTTSLPGTLIVHAGAFAQMRQADASDVSEPFTITEIDAGIYDVEGMGLKQRFGGIQRIFFDGGAGNDMLATGHEAGPGIEIGVPIVAYGGPGNDLLQGGGGHDLIAGGLGNDTLRGDGGNDTVYGGGGRDSVFGGEGDDLLAGNAGNDTLFGGSHNDTLFGGSGDDTLVGESGLDWIYGDSGHDLIDGGAGNDPVLWGGAGNDLVVGGGGLDSIFGGWGNDVLFAVTATSPSDNSLDYLEGGPDDDFICGSNGANLIIGGTGDVGLALESFAEPTPTLFPGGYSVTACGAMVQFTPTPPAAIVGSTFFDTDGDSVWEVGEAPLASVLVEIYDEYGDLVATATTGPIDVNDDGRVSGQSEAAAYRFTGLAPGDYRIVQSVLPNHQQSLPLDQDAHHLTLAAGETRTGVDFGSYRGGIIEGTKWNDLNGNRRRDPGEPPLAGVTVYLDEAAIGVLDEFDVRTTTDADGNYRFDSLLPGEYTVREATPLYGDDFAIEFYQTYPRRDVVYESDFSLFPGVDWSRTIRDEAGENSFLGSFGGETVGLFLDDLPVHGALTIEFDVYVFGAWEGNHTVCSGSISPQCNPDVFFAGVSGGTEFVRTTLSNTIRRQAFPAALGMGDFPPRSGAHSNNSLGFFLNADSVYRLRYTFAHATDAVTFLFGATGIEPNNTRWGLDNVRVTAGNDAHVVDLGPGETVTGVDFGNRRTTQMQLSVVTTPTQVDSRGRPFHPQFGAMPVPNSIGEVDEWQPFWAEIWVSSADAAHSLTEGRFDLSYNTAWTTARQVQFGPAFSALQTPLYDEAEGVVRGIRGGTALSFVGVDSPVLLARIYFAPQPNEDVPSSWPAQALQIGIDAARVTLNDVPVLRLRPEVSPDAATLIRANPADLDDDGSIGDGDFALFETVFGQTVAGAGSSLAALVDFDGSGVIDVGDFSILAARLGGAIPNFSPPPPASSSPAAPENIRVEALNAPQPAAAPPATPTNAILFTGFQFNDRDRDGFRDANEQGIAGITVYVDLNRNGVHDPFEPSALTTADDPATPADETGEYVIAGIYAAGSYVIRTELPSGMQATNSAPRLTSVSSTATAGFLHDIGTSVINARETHDFDLDAVKDWIGIATNPLDGQLYGATSTALYRLDAITGAAQYVARFDVSLSEGDIAFHPITGGLYAISRQPAGFTTLLRIDRDTGQTTVAAQFGPDQLLDPSAMAFNPAGQLFVVDTAAPARLWRIDVDQATATLLFENLFLHYSPGRVAGMTFDPLTGQFLFAAGLWESGTFNPPPWLYRIHPTTGVVTSSFSLPIDVAGLAWFQGFGVEVTAQFPGLMTVNLGAVTRYRVPDGSDTIHGIGGNDPVFGDNRISDPLALSEGDRDELYGNFGNDTLDGQDKNDILNGGDATISPLPQSAGDDDSLIGGPGIDEVRVQVDAPNIVLSPTLLTGQGRDTLSQIERASLTGGNSPNTIDAGAFTTGYGVNLFGLAGNDTLIGSPAADELWGGQSSDNLEGRDGDDRYIFELAINGGDVDIVNDTGEIDTGGIDTLDFSRLPSGLPVRLNMNQSQMSVDVGRLIQSPTPQNLENVIGTPGPDWLIGNDAPNLLDGGAGNDTLEGGGGDNTLVGGGGWDTLRGGADDDTYLFGSATVAESDGIEDAGGSDTIDFNALATPVTVKLYESAPLPGAPYLALHANREVQRIAGTIEHVVGGSGDDVLYSSPAYGSTLRGGEGADTFHLLTVTGDDTIHAEAVDTLSFQWSFNSVVVDLVGLPGQPQGTIAATAGHFVHLVGQAPNIVVGSSFADLIRGNSANNTLEGGNGNDTLEGGLGDDVYRFGVATGSPETDRINEVNQTSSRDVLDFSSLPAHVGVSATWGSGGAGHTNRTVMFNNPDWIEAVYGGEGRDVFLARLGSIELYGNGGNDTLISGGGNDLLVGGRGDDLYVFPTPNPAGELDTVRELPGEGIDRIDFGSLSTPVTVDLTHATQVAGHANRAVMLDPPSLAINFEIVVGSQGPNDITGNAADNTLVGGAGNDTIRGGAGRDELLGGGGINTLVGGAHDDLFGFSNVGGTHTLVEGQGSVSAGRFAGGGADALDFSSLIQTVVFDLAATDSQALQSGALTIAMRDDLEQVNGTYFETVIGSQSAGNHLHGNANQNRLIGGLLADMLAGREGNDILIGGRGNDTLLGNSGLDMLIGGDQIDLLQGEEHDDILFGANVGYLVPDGDTDVALYAILDFWAVPGLTLADRKSRIMAGLGPSGQYRLIMFDDGVADSLIGGDGQDWFVTYLVPDQILDSNPSPPAAAGGEGKEGVALTEHAVHVAHAAAPTPPQFGQQPKESTLSVEVAVVASPSATNHTDMPSSLLQLAAGQTFFVEVWAQGFVQSPGISGGFVDLFFIGAATAVRVGHEGFDLLADGRIDASTGRIDDLGGVRFGSGHGSAPQWTRLGYVEMIATAAGGVAIDLAPGKFQFANYGQGNVPWENVKFGGYSISSICTFNADLNRDGRVDRHDAAILARGYGVASGASAAAGDIDCDGAIDLDDLSRLQARLVFPSAPAAAAVVAANVRVYRDHLVDEAMTDDGLAVMPRDEVRRALTQRRPNQRADGLTAYSRVVHTSNATADTTATQVSLRATRRREPPLRAADAILGNW